MENNGRLNEVEQVLKRIEGARKDGWNLLIPSIPIERDEDSLFIPVLETVMISTDAVNGKEIYKGSESGQGERKTTKYRLHATALKKISNAGVVKWDGLQSGFVKDEKKNSVAFRAVGGVLKADGDIYQVAGYYDIDFDVVRENLVEQYQEKAKKFEAGKYDWWKKMNASQRKDYLAGCVDRDFRQKRQFAVQMCETGARNRVIRDLFQVKSEYTLDELKKPFLVLRYKLALNCQDPAVRQLILQEQVRAALGIYGAPGGLPALQAPIQPITANFTPIDPCDDPNLSGYDPEAPPPGDGDEPPAGVPADHQEADFQALAHVDQMNMLRDMAIKKGHSDFKALKDANPGLKKIDYFKLLK